MTGPEQEQQVGKLFIQRKQLKLHVACLQAKLGGWESDFRSMSSALSRVADGSLRLGQSEEENIFVVAASEDKASSVATQIRHRGGITYPGFEEIFQAILEIQQARMDLAQVESQLKDCGFD